MSLLRGTLDVLVLKALSWRSMHGFEIVSWIEERSDGNVAVNDGALFQALHRMEARGLISAEWVVTPNNRRARTYRLTASGRVELRSETVRLTRYAETLLAILRTRTT
jgi:transcriptional regulator